MNGVDAIAFTAGLGENDDITRKAICEYLGYLGTELDEVKNLSLIHSQMCIRDSSVSVRGRRAVTDFEYEIQIAQTNARLDKDLDTMFFTTSIEYSYVSSTIVKEIASYHGDVSEMVPPYVQECLEKKFKSQEANEYE